MLNLSGFFKKKPQEGYCRRFLTTLPRSGTHWLAGMISEVMGTVKFDGRIRDHQALKAALELRDRTTLYFDHLEYPAHSELLDVQKYPDLKLALLYRHPGDCLISQYHTSMTKIQKGIIEGNPRETFDEYFDYRFRDGKYRVYLQERVMGWLARKDVLSIRYEDLLADTSRELARALNFYEIDFNSKKLQSVIQSHSFTVLSGGRKPGDEDPSSHYRKGISAQWKSVLSCRQKEMMNDAIGDYLKILGYTLNEG